MRAPSRSRLLPLVSGIVSLACAACGTSGVLSARPLPVVLNPPTPGWGISVGIEPTDVLRVRLVNDSQEAVTVLWEESAYIDVNNRSHPVSAVSSRQSRSTVAPGTRLEETLVPLATAGHDPLDPLLPAKKRKFSWLRGSKERVHIGTTVRNDHPLLGKQIGLFLVLERSGERKTLLARYDLEDSS